MIPKVYASFEEFEKEEIRKLDSLRTTVDDMLQESFGEDNSFERQSIPARKRGRPRKKA